MTISASRLGDGLIKCYDNATYFDINQLSATDFRFLGRKVATVNAGFWLDETADYYDAAEPFLNEGTANASIVEGGKLVYTWSGTVERFDLTRLQLKGYIDEVLLLDGACMWNEDFTPPTEPF